VKEIDIKDLNAISGGVTENECIGAFTAVGLAVGFGVAGLPGLGAGGAVMGAVGMMVCGQLSNGVSMWAPSGGSILDSKPPSNGGGSRKSVMVIKRAV
jgi:bacteriocin-like protein